MGRESARPPQPVVNGVYFLFKDRALVYTGKSRDVYGRIDKHRVNGRQFDYAMIAACPEIDTDWIEAALIKSYQPAENRTGRVRPAPVLLERKPAPATDALPEDPDMVISRPRAIEYARHFRLTSTALNAAIDSGELPHRTDGRRAIILRVGDVREWCKRSVAFAA